MRRQVLSVVVSAAVLATGVGMAGAAPSSTPPTPPAPAPLGTSCATYGDQEICSGSLPSFDGAPLDFDVTKPTNGASGPRPLMIMLHGFGNDKHEWESTDDVGDDGDKWHWNSHWFASHGYYVLTYTARGFGAETQPAPYNPPTPSVTTCPGPNKGGSNCPALGGTIRVKNKNVEIRDTQWLAANVARAFPGVDTQRVAVTGGSYGGGESWQQAAEPVWTFPKSRNPALPVLNVQVAVPKYPWTDLTASLAPNGRVPGNTGEVYESSYGPSPSRREGGDPDGNGTPFGVGKASYTTALQALGYTTGDFAPETFPTPQDQGPDPETDPPFEPFTAWQARIAAGEPYSTGPGTDESALKPASVRDIRRAFSHWHSAYYRPEWRTMPQRDRTAVYSISGWTDDLFPAVESFRMFELLKEIDPLWPVEVEAADVGHSRAGNPSGTWHRLNSAAFGFLQSHINGSHPADTKVSSQVTTCADTRTPPAERVTARTPEALSNGTVTVRPAQPAVLTPTTGAGDPDGVATDAIAGGVIPTQPAARGGCTVSANPSTESGPFGYRSVSEPLPATRTTVGIGYVDAHYTATPGQSAVVAARVWDVAPDGTQLLVSRGVYRLDFLYGDPLTGTMRLPFYGNHFDLPVGHRLRLDLQQQDAPTYRPPTGPVSTVTLDDIRLVLPTRAAGSLVLPGT